MLRTVLENLRSQDSRRVIALDCTGEFGQLGSPEGHCFWTVLDIFTYSYKNTLGAAVSVPVSDQDRV